MILQKIKGIMQGLIEAIILMIFAPVGALFKYLIFRKSL